MDETVRRRTVHECFPTRAKRGRGDGAGALASRGRFRRRFARARHVHDASDSVSLSVFWPRGIGAVDARNNNMHNDKMATANESFEETKSTVSKATAPSRVRWGETRLSVTSLRGGGGSIPPVKVDQMVYEQHDERQRRHQADRAADHEILCLLYTSPSPRDRG